MNINKVLLLLTICLITPSCSLVHYLTVSERTNESMHRANEYLFNISGDTSFSFQMKVDYIDSLSTRPFALNTYKLNKGTNASPVQIRMYTPDGKFIMVWSQCFGNINRLGILDSIPFKKVSHLPINLNLSLQKDLELFKISEKEREKIFETIKDFDYVVILFWAMWTGWYSKDTIKRLYRFQELNGESSILILKLNTSP